MTRLVVVLLMFGCNDNAGRAPGSTGATGSTTGSGGNNDMGIGPPPIGGLIITPPMTTLSITSGGPAATQAFTVAIHGQSSDTDVTSSSSFSLDDATIGSMSGATFTTSGVHGGIAHLTASNNGQMATALIIVNVKGGFSDGDCPSCPAFPPDSAPACSGPSPAPTLVYPPDGVLLPPNMEQLSVHYLPAAGATEYEIDFENANTDVRITQNCSMPPKDSRGNPSGGCVLNLSPTEWDFIAKSNKGGDPITVKVRATSDGNCATPSAATANISITEEDVSGGIYYWKSTVSANGTGGQVWRKSFGDNMAEQQITNAANANGTCFGCHFLSRDGIRMSVNGDDDDSDDEYSDVNSGLVDVASKAFVTTGMVGRGGPGLTQAPGFQTFSPDHSLYLGSDGTAGGGTPNAFFLWNGASGAAALPSTVVAAAAGERVTMPDWSADNLNIVYVVPGSILSWMSSGGGRMHQDDDHMTGGSLWVMPHMTGTQFGTPAVLVQSQGENNYYPGYSPDGAFVIFNRVAKQAAVNDNDSFANPNARVFILPTMNAMGPIDCALLNSTGSLSNSWPRWSPFIQTYKGNKLLWVTFSSTRDYGVLVKNGTAGLTQCYPPDTPQNPGPHGNPFPATCKQPQIWMAAINLSSAEFSTGDPSYPAFWLPFQDLTTHNHTAQWTTSVVNTPPPDGGACIDSGQDCTKNPNGCCIGVCNSNGVCAIP